MVGFGDMHAFHGAVEVELLESGDEVTRMQQLNH